MTLPIVPKSGIEIAKTGKLAVRDAPKTSPTTIAPVAVKPATIIFLTYNIIISRLLSLFSGLFT